MFSFPQRDLAQNYIFAVVIIFKLKVKKLSTTDERKLLAPCGLYCGSCVDYVEYKRCHGCNCTCGTCASLKHHELCDIYKCCVEKNIDTCQGCDDLPCSKLIQFCYSPIWTHHFPVIENLRRQKAVGTEKWLKEQREIWSSEWYLKRWLWLQKECEKKLQRFQKEAEKP